MTESEFLAAFNKPWQIPQVADEPFSQAKRPAAVLICLNPVDHELHIILTKRAAHLKHHAGQISFPGGKAEAQDKNLIHTAYRETEEEIGLQASDFKLIGTLPSYRTISGFVVTPVVAKHKRGVCLNADLTLDPNEVSEAFQVPLAFLLNEHNYFVHQVNRADTTHPVNFIHYEGHLIWGATAGMLAHLRDHILCHCL